MAALRRSVPRRARLAAVALLGLLLLPAAAASVEPEGWAYDAANELMSPFCPGRTLSDCPSPQAESLRMWIVVQEAAGRARDDVEAELYERYGEIMRPAPKAEGFGLTAYLIPVFAALAGGALLAVFLRGQTRRDAAAPQAAPGPIDPELERLVDEEMAG